MITPVYFRELGLPQSAPFGTVLKETLIYLSTGNHGKKDIITHEDYSKASAALMACTAIDIDFRKIVDQYWKTYLPDSPDQATIEQIRAELLQWFSGEGNLSAYRRRFGVNKLVSRDNAQIMLQSLSAFIRLAGYRGLVILFDEAEMSYSVMRKNALKDAHNNLLHLINNVERLPGMFLLYATTPDFYTDPNQGIVIYGALQSRIGKPEDRVPRALDVVWNLDAINFELPQYQEVGRKIRSLYMQAYPGAEKAILDDNGLDDFVSSLHALHPTHSPVRFWRVLTTGCIRQMDNFMEGDSGEEVKKIYKDVMLTLREN